MRNLIILSLILFFIAGCTSKPLYRIRNQPIPNKITGELRSLEDVGKAIMDATKRRGWTPVLKRPGLIEASILRRSHRAVVEISYSQSNYSINYKDSSNLDYNGNKIHRNYNNWIVKLSTTIQQYLN